MSEESEVIRLWALHLKGAVPPQIDASVALRIEGSAASPQTEARRVAALIEWMWEALSDTSISVDSFKGEWEQMLTERTPAAASAFAASAYDAVDLGLTTDPAYTAYTAYTAYSAADAMSAYNSGYRIASSDVADAVVYAGIITADEDAYWARRDVPGMLTRLLDMED